MPSLRHFILISMLFFSTAAYTQILSGSATLQLSGPATKEQSEEARSIAKEKFKVELLQWLDEQMSVRCDTSNSLQMYHFNSFVDSCVRQSKEEATFKGKALVLTYLLPYEKAESVLQSYNSYIDSLTIQTSVLLKSAYKGNNPQRIYSEGIKTLSYASARLGPAVTDPDTPEKTSM